VQSISDFCFAYHPNLVEEEEISMISFIVITTAGTLYSQSLSIGANMGALPLKQQIKGATNEVFDHPVGVSVSFFHHLNALIYSFENGKFISFLFFLYFLFLFFIFLFFILFFGLFI